MDIEARILALETWKYQIDVLRGKEEVDRKHLDKRFDDLEAGLKDLQTTAKWLNRTIGAAIAIYLVNYVMNGGLASLGAQ